MRAADRPSRLVGPATLATAALATVPAMGTDLSMGMGSPETITYVSVDRLEAQLRDADDVRRPRRLGSTLPRRSDRPALPIHGADDVGPQPAFREQRHHVAAVLARDPPAVRPGLLGFDLPCGSNRVAHEHAEAGRTPGMTFEDECARAVA